MRRPICKSKELGHEPVVAGLTFELLGGELCGVALTTVQKDDRMRVSCYWGNDVDIGVRHSLCC
jgi:hypothetical protein